ncbi:MAG TPA: ABC transporter permease, partial [Gaiellaceae bacterium]|nr:ABC transporter permease [Gaiellaceae bacterium]
GSVTDLVVMTAALVGISTPVFWLALMLILVFAVWLGWLPVSGYGDGSWRHLVLPAVALGALHAGVLARMTRASLLEVVGQEYVRTARAKGLPERRVVGIHAVRNSLITVTTVIGIQLGVLISGAVITEQIFGIAGFGRLTIDAVNQRDYALIQGVVLVAAAGYVVVNLCVDVVYSLLNPRIRVSGAPT